MDFHCRNCNDKIYSVTEETMKLLKITAIFITSIFFIYSESLAISPAVKSNKDYYLTTKVLREMKSMMTNFKTDDNQKSYDILMKKFEEATLDYYGANYDSSAIKYYNLKLELIKTLENLCNLYIDRTKEILTATAADNNTIEVFLTFSKSSGYAKYFNTPFNPLKDVMPYNDKFTARDFHLFYDLQRVESCLKDGNFNYNQAKRIFTDPEIAFIKSRKKITQVQLDYIIDKYMKTIEFCRLAKQQGLEIYKIKNDYATSMIQVKYNLTKYQITPIFDDRIPEKFKVDAVDNAKLLYPVEVERRKKTESKNK